jgi:DNA helicase-2/ATP-dependent DNA helicase PcrA
VLCHDSIFLQAVESPSKSGRFSLEWDAVFLPALEEGLLPIRQAKDEEAIAEERRLLYVGVTRARHRLTLSWAARRVTAGGRATPHQPSRFLVALALPSSSTVAAARPGGHQPSPTPADPAMLGRLHDWRRDRARRDSVPAYVIAEDATLAAIADARPDSIEALRRVRGIGPVRAERYGVEILAILRNAT